MQTIELTTEESRIWQERKSIVVIQPMEIQPKSEHNEWGRFHGWKDLKAVFRNKDDIKSGDYYPIKFKQGDKIKLKYIEECVRHGKYDCGGEWRKKTTVTIKEILEPKRVSDIDNSIWWEIMPNNEYIKSDWFNNKYSKPIPVECEECSGNGKILLSNLPSLPCRSCNGDGIEKYIVYCYDKTPELLWRDEDFDFIHKDGYDKPVYNDKPLDIIVNPFCEIIRIGE